MLSLLASHGAALEARFIPIAACISILFLGHGDTGTFGLADTLERSLVGRVSLGQSRLTVVEADIEDRRAMGQPAHGDQIDTCRGDGRRRRRGYATRRLGYRPAGNHSHRQTKLVQRHIVEQHGVGGERQDLFQLGQRVDLDFDLDEMADAASSPLDSWTNPAGNRDVVVLDHDRVVEAETVIGAATGTHRVFFDGS